MPQWACFCGDTASAKRRKLPETFVFTWMVGQNLRSSTELNADCYLGPTSLAVAIMSIHSVTRNQCHLVWDHRQVWGLSVYDWR